MPDAIRYFRARHLATMTAAGLIEDGCVAVENGRIVAVGPTRDLKPPRVDDDVSGLIAPGLINAHTHLELTNVARPPSAGTLPEWLFELMTSLRQPDDVPFAERRSEAVRQGVAQCLKFGVTCVGDVAQSAAVVRGVLAEGPLRAVSYGECLGRGDGRGRFAELLAAAVDRSMASERVLVGVSPHAPYTVDAKSYAAAWSAGHATAGVMTHLAETPDEADFLLDGGGGFGGLYARLGRTDAAGGDGFTGTPVEWLHCIVQPVPGSGRGDVLAHVNYCTDADITRIAKWGIAVAWCPRTHAYFRHPPHRWRAMLERGVRVCIGTDSCASSPDLNLMDDLRLVRQQNPDVPAETLWDLVTASAADALRWDSAGRPALGRITVGAAADFVAWPTENDLPLDEVLDDYAIRPSRVWIGGDPIASVAGDR